MKGIGESRAGMIVAGASIGVIAALLVHLGNPPNMGVCVACFTRDIAGAIGLHGAAAVHYIRPEIIGLLLGSFIAALIMREWKPRGGSSPLIRFVLGMLAMIGALVFLGCPWRVMLRLSGGDLTALVGLIGLVVGVGIASLFIKSGYTIKRKYPLSRAMGLILPAFMLLLLALLFVHSSFGDGKVIHFTAPGQGPGGMRAAPLLALGLAMIVGALAQRTRFCTVGAMRDVLLIRNMRLASGVLALIAAAFLTNLLLGHFSLGWQGMPLAHSNMLWNFMGMWLAGMAFVMAGGCPGRQLFLAGEGDADAAVFWLGMLAGAAVAHTWNLAAVPDQFIDGSFVMGGPGIVGKSAVVAGIAFCVLLGVLARAKTTVEVRGVVCSGGRPT